MNNNGYNGNASLKRAGIDLSYTEKEVLELAKCVENPTYFIDNYCYIVTLDHGIQPFKLYDCQKEKVETMDKIDGDTEIKEETKEEVKEEPKTETE